MRELIQILNWRIKNNMNLDFFMSINTVIYYEDSRFTK